MQHPPNSTNQRVFPQGSVLFSKERSRAWRLDGEFWTDFGHTRGQRDWSQNSQWSVPEVCCPKRVELIQPSELKCKQGRGPPSNEQPIPINPVFCLIQSSVLSWRIYRKNSWSPRWFTSMACHSWLKIQGPGPWALLQTFIPRAQLSGTMKLWVWSKLCGAVVDRWGEVRAC